jgi:cyanophycinase
MFMRYVSGVAGLVLATVVTMTPSWAAENLLGLPEAAIAARGALVIVGGGRTTEAIREEFIRLAGGPRARIVLIPSACTYDSVEAMKDYFSVWREYPVASLEFLDTASRQQADSPEFIRPLLDATGVWMPGGSQGRLAELYAGTLVEQAIRHVLERGGVVGGTSAGAAIMSRVMILEGTNCDAVLSRGFGFLEGAVVDQHFSQRGRYGRLLKVVEEHPGLLGLGIDESTALVVEGNHLRVLGQSRVTVCIPAEAHRATLVYRLKPGEDVELTPTGPTAKSLPIRVALRKPQG